MGDQLEVLKDVVSRLERAGIPYMVSGSVALNYYGQPRMTRDIDLVVEMSEADADVPLRAFSGDYYVPQEAVRAAVRDRGIFSLIHLRELVKVDFIVRKEDEFRRTEFRRRREVRIEGRRIAVVTPEDLLLSKLVWSRGGDSGVQIRDAENLAASVEGMDWDYLRSWSAKLGVEVLLEGLRS